MKKTTLLLSTLIFFVVSTFAQQEAPAKSGSASASTTPDKLSWRKNRKLAKKSLKKGSLETATAYLEAGAAKKPKKTYFATTLAPTELTLRDYTAANKWYKTLVDKDSVKHKKPEYLFQYAMTQKYLGQYEEAEKNFKKYTKLAKDDDASVELKKRAKREAEGCRKGIFFRDSVEKPAFKVRHLDGNLNQPYADFSPMMKDDALYFTSLKSNQTKEVNKKEVYSTYSRIYKSQKNGNEFTPGVEISENVNVPNVHVGNPAFTKDGNTMYYTQCTQTDLQHSKCNIFVSKLVNGVWEKGVNAGAVNDPLYTSTQPAVGKNKEGDDVVYFVSDRNPGKGLDIFVSKINTDGSLSKPRSVGPQINSKLDEVTPFYEPKTNTLYFSSNGWINIGGFDVFRTTWDNGGEWMEPENLGLPVNSSVDDINFTLNEANTKGFIVSNRAGGMSLRNETCCDDIFFVETSRLFLAVNGKLFEEKDSVRTLADNGNVVLFDERNGFELGQYNVINGQYFFDLEPNRGYKLTSKKDGYYETQLSFNTDNRTSSDTLLFDLILKKKVEVNPLFGRRIGTIYYEYDRARILPEGRDTLKKVVDILKQYPNAVIEVGAHTDGKGTEDYNLKLSQHRAAVAINYFVYEKKLNKARFVAKAYGTSQPAAPNTKEDGKDNPEGRAKNRRTIFTIIDELKPIDSTATPTKK